MYKRNLRSRFAVFKHGNNVDIKPLLDSKDDLKIALNFLSRLYFIPATFYFKKLSYVLYESFDSIEPNWIYVNCKDSYTNR